MTTTTTASDADVVHTPRAVSTPSRLPIGHRKAPSLSVRGKPSNPTPAANNASMAPPPRPIRSIRPSSLIGKSSDSKSSIARSISLESSSSSSSGLSHNSVTAGISQPSSDASSLRHSRHASTSTTTPRAGISTQASTHTRTRSQAQPKSITLLKAPSGSSSLPPPLPTQEASSLRQSSHASRPNFSTLQQHYSPARNLAPKPLSSSFLAPPSPSKQPANIAITSEIAKLQAELLQLHLLHCDSFKVEQSYKESASRHVKRLFEIVTQQDERLRDEERKIEEKRALSALQQWEESDTPENTLADKIQALDSVLSEVMASTEPTSKLQKLIRQFEAWMLHVQHTHTLRDQGQLLEIDMNMLDNQWEMACHNLLRIAHANHEKASNLGRLSGDSALARLLVMCQVATDNSVEQIKTMLGIRASVQKAEREWISRVCEEDSDDEGIFGRSVGGAWRA